MNAETAERIVREVEKHNSGLLTLRQCAELAGYTRDYVIKAYQVFADSKIAEKKGKAMSGYKPKVGDFIIIERQDSGRQFTAMVDHVTKGGNVQFKAPKIGTVGWAKVRTANIRNERIVRKATQEEAAALMRQMEGGA